MRWLAVRVAEAIIRLVAATLRLTVDDGAEALDRPDRAPVIIAFWHNRTGLMPYFCERFLKGRSPYTFISASRDGQFIADVAARFGVLALRGSSSRRGALAALGAMRVSSDSRADLVITPDGPRGPRYCIGEGLIRVAQLTNRPVVAMTFQLAWKWELSSWDRFQIPLPFSRCHFVTRGPIFIPANASADEVAQIKEKILGALY